MALRTGSRDVAVVGGGPAGAAVAATLHAHGVEVTLIDAGGSGRSRPGESLPPGTGELVDEIFGAGTIPAAAQRLAHANRSVWGSSTALETEFAFNPFGDGAHVDRSAFEAALRGALRASGVRVLEEEATPAACAAPIVVDAGGRAAPIARSRGARRKRLDHLVAEFALFDGPAEDDADTATLVEAVADGWWYTTPLPGGRRIAAFVTDSDLLPRDARLRAPEGWIERLADAPAVHESLVGAGYSLAAAPRTTDASTSHLDRLGGPGWLAVGDAAVSFDPLSSQGILTALVMGREAGGALAAMLVEGDPAPLERYADDYARVLQEHLRQSAECYSREGRWRAAPFWRRRRAILGGAMRTDDKIPSAR